MKLMLSLSVLVTILAISGCSRTPSGKPSPNDVADAAKHGNDEATILANLAKLNPEDRNLAEEQQYCAVETKNLLGSMGAPYKVMLNEQPVFLCCDGCETRAKAHVDRTLAKAQQLRESKGKASSK